MYSESWERIKDTEDIATIEAWQKKYRDKTEAAYKKSEARYKALLGQREKMILAKWAKQNVGATKPEDFGGGYKPAKALKMCPAGWRVPTKADFEELLYLPRSNIVINFHGRKVENLMT